MNGLLSISLLILISITGYSQNKKLSNPEPYFTAIIVSNIDTAIYWYSDKLGFEVLNQVDLVERGIKQANLKCGNTLIDNQYDDRLLCFISPIVNYCCVQ